MSFKEAFELPDSKKKTYLVELLEYLTPTNQNALHEKILALILDIADTENIEEKKEKRLTFSTEYIKIALDLLENQK